MAVTLCQTEKGREEDCCGRKLMNSVWKLLSQKCLRGQQRRLRRKMKVRMKHHEKVEFKKRQEVTDIVKLCRKVFLV